MIRPSSVSAVDRRGRPAGWRARPPANGSASPGTAPLMPRKTPSPLVLDLGQLAVHRHRRAHHLAAERLADRLMAEADAEDRDGRRRLGDQVEADAGLVRRAGAGREHDRLRRPPPSPRSVAILSLRCTTHVRPQLAQVVEQVEGEAVVVVDQDDHGVLVPAQGLRAFSGKGETGFPSENAINAASWAHIRFPTKLNVL